VCGKWNFHFICLRLAKAFTSSLIRLVYVLSTSRLLSFLSLVVFLKRIRRDSAVSVMNGSESEAVC
jgi:hypothetical protein